MSGSAFLFLVSLGTNLLSFSVLLSLKTLWFAIIMAIIGSVLLYFFDVNKTALMLQFDTSICLLFLMIIMEMNPYYSVAGLFFAFLGNFVYNRKNSPLFFALSIGVSSLGIFVFTKYIAEDFGFALVKTTNFFVNIIKWIFNKIWQFFVWISSLFPQVEADGYEVENKPFSYEVDIEEGATPSEIAQYIVYAIVCAVILYLLFIFIKYMIEYRKGRVKIERLQVTEREKKKRKLFSFGTHYKRGTILWRYNKIKRSLKFTPKHKKKNETPKEFLERTEEQGITEAVNVALYAKKDGHD